MGFNGAQEKKCFPGLQIYLVNDKLLGIGSQQTNRFGHLKGLIGQEMFNELLHACEVYK